MKITTYKQAEEYLAGGKNKDSRRIAANKKLNRLKDGSIEVELYETAIVTYHKDGKITVDNGGWATQTTHRHMNKHLPIGYCVRGHKGKTIFCYPGNKETGLGKLTV